MDRKPDVVIDIGDWWDLCSIYMFDHGGRGRKQFEGQRYVDDIGAGIDAMERVKAQLDDYNRGVRKNKRYQPRFVRTLGNHEERIGRVIEAEPRFEGIIGYDDLMSAEFGWEQHLPGEVVEVDGISYTHSLNSSALYIAAAALRSPRIGHRSSATGHTHRRDYHEVAGPEGRIASVNVGCYFDYEHDWLPKSDQARWWRGLTWLTNVRNGSFDVEFQSLEEVRRKYS